jgi:carboxypeptidase T
VIVVSSSKPPWEAGAVGITMAASDGSFNTTRETATASLGSPNAVLPNITTGVGGGNIAPVANFSASTSGLTANFTDSDGSIASRTWDFGDGTLSTAANPSRTYSAAGTCSVGESLPAPYVRAREIIVGAAAT